MKIQYQIDTTKRVITETWPEIVSFEDYKQVKQSEFNDPDFDPDFNVITDMSLLNLELNVIIIDKIINFIDNNSNTMKDRKSAILTKKPNQVVNSFVFRSGAKNLPLNIKVFSTMEGALNWISEE